MYYWRAAVSMEKQKIVDLILDRQNKIDQMIHGNYHKLAQKFGLSLDQFHLLLELDDFMTNIGVGMESPTIGLLAENINVSQNTISERVSRLEKKGVVKRMTDQKDRRINHVVLTDSGTDLMNTIRSGAETDFVRNALLRMQTEELENFLSCYENFIAQIKD